MFTTTVAMYMLMQTMLIPAPGGWQYESKPVVTQPYTDYQACQNHANWYAQIYHLSPNPVGNTYIYCLQIQ